MTVHGLVRLSEERFDGIVDHRIEFDIAGGEGNLKAHLFLRGIGLDPATQSGEGRGVGVFGAGSGEEHSELIAAEACNHVAFAKDHGECHGEDSECVITGGMAVKVVDGFESIQIKEKQGGRLAEPSTDAEGVTRQGFKSAPVGDGGEVIGGSHLNGGEFLLRKLAEVFEELELFGVEGTGLVVDDAEGSEVVIAHLQRAAGVEANVGLTGDEGVVGEAGVVAGVGHHHDFVGQDGVRAEGELTGSFAGAIAGAGLEPLAVSINQGDLGDGRAEDPLGEAGEAVEALFRLGIENI